MDLLLPDIRKLPHRLDPQTQRCRAVIETPQGCRSKYDYEPESGLFALAGVLPAGMAFPLDFGFIPATEAEDGDPVDVLVLADEPGAIGSLVEIQLLGAIEAEQTEEQETVRNDRLIAKIAQSHTYRDVDGLDQLGKAFVEDLQRFFVTYNELKGKRFRVLGTGDSARAAAIIRDNAAG